MTIVLDPPLHGLRLPPDEWWACEYPERPSTENQTWFEHRCRACAIALGASTLHHYSEPVYDQDRVLQGTHLEVYNSIAPGFGLPVLTPTGERVWTHPTEEPQ